MSGVSHTIDDATIQAALGQLQRAADDARPALEAIGAYFVTSTQLNIERETSPDGRRFAPLSPRTAAKRVGKGRRGFDHILREKTRLYRSISYDVDAQSVEWGSNVAYAAIHQFGGEISIPPRTGRVSLKSIRRQGGGIRSRFVRSGTKGALERTVQIRGHVIRIPARPYLGISAADRDEVPQIIADHLRQEAGL